jgi:hypothetical protein
MDNIDTDTLCEQIDLYNKNYEWIIKESERILVEMNKLDRMETFQADKYEVLSRKHLELQQRYNRDKDNYNQIIKTVRTYFNEKHGIDIIGLLEGDIDEVK